MSNIKKLRLVFGIIAQVNPTYFVLLVFRSLTRSCQVLINVILPKFLIDELTGEQNVNRLLIRIGLLVGGNLLFAFLSKTAKRLCDVSEKRSFVLIDSEFSRKIMTIDYANLEDPHCLDLKERASFAIRTVSAVSNLINDTLTFVSELLTVAGLVTVMFTLSWVLVAALLVTVGLTLLIQAGFSKYQQKFYSELLPVNRRYGYYANLPYERALQKDARLYNMNGMICGAISGYAAEINVWFKSFYIRMGLSLGLFQVVTVLQTVLTYGYVGTRTLDGSVSIGDLTMYVASAIGFSGAIIALGESAINIMQMLGYLDPFAELMSLPDEATSAGTLKLGDVKSIRFEHVTFSYPKSDKKVLDDISFSIAAGEKISVVGRNGAGKSTVVKLIARLYTPDKGTIYINDVDIAEYDRESYLAAVSAVFQDFRLFDLPVIENITCNAENPDRASAEKLIENVGMKERVDALPKGLDTLIGREYDDEGCEFSGGQAQKIAIARAMYKNSPIIILDEPTSALDPKSEAEIYENFNSFVGDRTTIYISHRMSSAHFCDRILVINGGKIEAFDTHENLMKDTEGTYCRLFTAQAVNYRMGSVKYYAQIY